MAKIQAHDQEHATIGGSAVDQRAKAGLLLELRMFVRA